MSQANEGACLRHDLLMRTSASNTMTSVETQALLEVAIPGANCLCQLLAPITTGASGPSEKLIVVLFWLLYNDSNKSQPIVGYLFSSEISASEGDHIWTHFKKVIVLCSPNIQSKFWTSCHKEDELIAATCTFVVASNTTTAPAAVSKANGARTAVSIATRTAIKVIFANITSL